MLRRPHYIALSLVALFTLALMSQSGQTTAALKWVVGTLFLPLFGLTASVERSADSTAYQLVPKSELARRVEELERFKAEQSIRQLQIDEILRENHRLRAGQGFAQNTPWRLRAAQVVGRDPSSWWKNVKINLGSRDGLRADLAVLTADGLVGRVSTVGLTHSQVVLIGDPDCRVSTLMEETRDHGVIGPEAGDPVDDTLVTVTHLPRSGALRPGQRVFTSGLGGVFPRGILVGRVIDSAAPANRLYREARVKLAANLGALQEVWVIFP